MFFFRDRTTLYKVQKSQLMWQILILFQRRFESVTSVHFQALMMKGTSITISES